MSTQASQVGSNITEVFLYSDHMTQPHPQRCCSKQASGHGSSGHEREVCSCHLVALYSLGATHQGFKRDPDVPLFFSNFSSAGPSGQALVMSQLRLEIFWSPRFTFDHSVGALQAAIHKCFLTQDPNQRPVVFKIGCNFLKSSETSTETWPKFTTSCLEFLIVVCDAWGPLES